MENKCCADTSPSGDRKITITALSRRKVQCVGPWFLAHVQGKLIDAKQALSHSTKDDEEEDSPNSTMIDEDDVELLRKLDPKDWKSQDHYAVLGLSKLRYKATEEDVKRAYRLKVLLHHPDKRKASGEEIRPDDDYFTCITKAFEILGNPLKRRSFDSIDPYYKDPSPPLDENTKKNFYEVFGEAFALEARFSRKVPVPQLGGPDASRESVEKFYHFWYNFESWREYSYLDLDDKEKGHGREERRWIEKSNKFTRSKRKKQEGTRLRALIDNAYALDPRIPKFKQEDKEQKEAAKQAKKEAAKARQMEEERRQQAIEEEKRKKRAEMEAAEKARLSALKAEKEAHKKVLKSKRTSLRKLVKLKNYFIEDEDERVRHMESLEKLCNCLKVEQFDELLEKIQSGGRGVYIKAIEDMEKRSEEERQVFLAAQCGSGTSGGEGSKKQSQISWTADELQLLIKAVNLFPAGTNQRWEVVANFINQHDPKCSEKKTAKDVLAKAKSLQSSDFSKLKKQGFLTLEKEKCTSDSGATATDRHNETPGGENSWTGAEQKLLEQALRTFPASTPNRWDRIAECIPSRSKKQVVMRYKEIADMVKAKKAAQAATEQKKK